MAISDWSTGSSFVTTNDFNAMFEEGILDASDGANSHQFGYSVSINGDGSRVIIGAHGVNSYRGSAYIFARSGTTWTEEAILNASDGAGGHQFGESVSISNDGSRVVVGAIGVNSSRGLAYVFIRDGNTWTEEAILSHELSVLDSGNQNHFFGISVAIDTNGTRIVVGASGSDNFNGIGQIYIFIRSGTTWTREFKTQGTAAGAFRNFGERVSIDYDCSRVIVGSRGSNTEQGRVYIFVRSGTTWTQEALLAASNAANYNHFGQSVAISGNGSKAVIGAIAANGNLGSAYIFTRSGTTWTQEAILNASDSTANHRLGFSVSIDNEGNRALIGTEGRQRVYIYGRENTTWDEKAILISSDGFSGGFGRAVAISNDNTRAVIGAVSFNSSRGRAYIFS